MLTLLQTSQNRRYELQRFIKSLNAQIGLDFNQIQLIFVDQENNKDIFSSLNKNIDYTYIKYHHCSLSHARNVGLKYVKGEYIGFPDDDCWYEPDTIKKLFDILGTGKYQGVSGKGLNEESEVTSIFLKNEDILTTKTFYSAISYTLFLKFEPTLFFDERIGVGSPYNLGSGEESDYLLSLITKYNYKILFTPSIIIHHPTFMIADKRVFLKKSYSYARGLGFLLKKHDMGLGVILLFLIRPLTGVILYALSFNGLMMKKSFYNLKGRLEGYFFRF